MSREALAAAFDQAAEALAQVAHELRAAAGAAPAPSPASAPSSVADDLPPVPVEFSRDRCPAHMREWKQGTYGPYCTAKSDDPAWSKENKKTGERYCSITPKNAPDWLRVHGLVAAA